MQAGLNLSGRTYHIVGNLMSWLKKILFFFKFHCLAPPTPVFPNQYGTIIEANIVEKNLTVTAQEYFDRDGNRAVLTMRQNNTVHDLVFDYSNDQLFYVTGW